jgi:O-antigen ligase
VPMLVLAAVLLIGLGVFGGQSTTLQRLGSITHPLTETDTGNGDILRVAVWREALAIAEQHPIAGVGLGESANLISQKLAAAGTSGQGGNAQSVYLQLFAEGGLLAVCGLIAVLIALGRDLFRFVGTERIWGAALAGASVAMLTCWLTDVTIRYSGVAVCMGVIFGIVAGGSRGSPEAVAR